MSVPNYTETLLQEISRDLHLESMSEVEKEKVLSAVSERLHNVVINTLLRLANPEQKSRLLNAFKSGANVETVITEISAEIPDFSTVLEEALRVEYEHLTSMAA